MWSWTSLNFLEVLLTDSLFLCPGPLERFKLFEQATRPRGTDDDPNLCKVRQDFLYGLVLSDFDAGDMKIIISLLSEHEAKDLLISAIEQMQMGADNEHPVRRSFGRVIEIPADSKTQTVCVDHVDFIFRKEDAKIRFGILT